MSDETCERCGLPLLKLALVCTDCYDSMSAVVDAAMAEYRARQVFYETGRFEDAETNDEALKRLDEACRKYWMEFLEACRKAEEVERG